MKYAASLGILFIALLLIIPAGRADDLVSYLAYNPIYSFKDSNDIFYVFYRDNNNNVRYSYYDDYWFSSVIVSGNVVGDDDFVAGYYGHSYVLILYKQWVSGSNYNVYVLKCSLPAPVSCSSPVQVKPAGEDSVSAQELSLTYNPAGGTWYLGYVYYSTDGGGYEYITFRSTDGSTWTMAEWSYPGSTVPSSPFRFHVTAIPGTTNAFAFIAARVDEGYYRYCIVIIGSQSCASMPNTIGTKTVNQAAPPIRGIPSTSSGNAEIFTNNQWFRCTSSSCTTGTTLGATWTDPVSLMREGGNIYMFYMPSNIIKRRTVTSSIGPEINYLVAGTGSRYGVGVPVEATTPRPIAYLTGSDLYVHVEPTLFTRTLGENIVISRVLSSNIGLVKTLSEMLTSLDTANRVPEYVRMPMELLGVSDYFAGFPSFTLPDVTIIFDVISYTYVSSEGGGGGGGPAAPPPPPEPPSVEIPVESVPTQPIAFGSIVVAGVLLAVFTALSLRGRRTAVGMWRRRRARARRLWR